MKNVSFCMEDQLILYGRSTLPSKGKPREYSGWSVEDISEDFNHIYDAAFKGPHEALNLKAKS